jgi:hypothetical protein
MTGWEQRKQRPALVEGLSLEDKIVYETLADEGWWRTLAWLEGLVWKDYLISTRGVTNSLALLEKLGLVEWHEDGRVRTTPVQDSRRRE